MNNTRSAEQVEEAGAPLTDAEQDQAGYALRQLARSRTDPDALKIPQEQLDMVRPFFELGWALGVRTGHTGPAMAGVPVDRATVAHAWGMLRCVRVVPQLAGPVVWQKVRYHGSLTQRHGAYWVYAIHTYTAPFSEVPESRYDLCDLRGVGAVKNVRRMSLTPLHQFRALA
ncbi:hypothetical protein AB0H82_11115 [Streptomyces sp. NPDC050732]|uniref:hypothetical protein n=1 Tax=Streptomyces sp. NPDC050732 TaxID=3154632 RepID=UPI00341DB127